jgi:hypothetical protein
MHLKDCGVMRQQWWDYGTLVRTSCYNDIRCFDQAIRRIRNKTEVISAPQRLYGNGTANRCANEIRIGGEISDNFLACGETTLPTLCPLTHRWQFDTLPLLHSG